MAPAAPLCDVLRCAACWGEGLLPGTRLVLQLPPPRQHPRPPWCRVRLNVGVGGLMGLGRRLGPAGPSVTPRIFCARAAGRRWATPNRTPALVFVCRQPGQTRGGEMSRGSSIIRLPTPLLCITNTTTTTAAAAATVAAGGCYASSELAVDEEAHLRSTILQRHTRERKRVT
jgi:hypothetical protein